MDKNQRTQVDSYLSHLDGLIRRGRQLSDALANDHSNESVIAAARTWQKECGVTINQLSGGSKAHWLARSFSGAFLMRTMNGRAVETVAASEIVKRLLGVLEQAVTSLSGIDDSAVAAASPEAASTPHRFDFVHNLELRPVVERAYTDSRRAIEQGDFELAFITSCGILEAIVTDALEHVGLSALAISGTPATIADWSFEMRLAVAERAGLIRGGCARLPVAARTYRDHGESFPKAGVSEHDARRVGQVLHVVMRDLDPGR